MSDQQAWKCGNEFLPYHRSASHVNPDHRDGWNACFAMAHSRIEADETLMRTMLDALESCDPGDFSTGHVIHASYNEAAVEAAITALRTRLETSK